MKKQCPNCSKEFVEQIDLAFRCEDCGWFKNVDGHWHPCPEPSKVTEPDLLAEPDLPKVPKAPAEPEVTEDDNVRSYLGGLLTVTVKDDQNEEEIN